MTQNALDQYALANGYGKTTAKMSEQEKDSMYRYIIEMMLIDNSSKCRTKKPPENKIQNT